MMQIKTFYCNPYRECTYIIKVQNAECTMQNECLIVDPGMYGEKEEKRVLDYLQENNLTPTAILITHYHPDHICGLECIQQHYPSLPVLDWQLKIKNEELDNLQIYKFTNLQILPTPGHKEDAVCFYFPEEKVIFTGDTLFQESIGRTDLPGGNMGQLIKSLNELKKLPEDTKVYPGHGYETSIGHEKQFNPYL